IEPGSALAGRSLKDSRVRQELGIIIVAIKKPDGRMVFNPPPEEAMQAGDLLITLGHRDQLERLEVLARAERREGRKGRRRGMAASVRCRAMRWARVGRSEATVT